MTVKLKTPSNGSVSLTPQDTASDVVLTVPSGGTGSQLAVADSSGYTYSGGLVVSPQTGFKNRIINGDMRIDQRNNGASVTNSTGLIYTLDRWAVQTVGSSCSIQQVAGSTGNNKALRVTGATGNSNTLVSQKIEAANIYDCAGQTVTVSFTIYGSGSGTIGVRFLYPTATDNFASTTEPVVGITVNFTTTATTYTVTRTLDANANKGLWLVFERGATGAGVTYSLENVQLEKGSVATPFEFRSIGQELALCQRYYYRVTAPATQYLTPSLWVTASTTAKGTMAFPVIMRIAPTALEQTGTAANYRVFAGNAITACSAVPTFDNATQNMGSFNLTVASGLTIGQGGAALAGSATSGYLGWSAEL